jgi:capsular polysaccharide biosynthesis protein
MRRLLLIRWPVLLAIGVVAFGVAAAYLAFAEKEYEAVAKIQISPVRQEDDTFAGFSVFREDTDEASAAETAAALVETSGVAAAAAIRLRADRDELVDAVDADGSGRSTVVDIRARADSAQRAAQIANAFADEFVAQRSARFQAELARATDRLRERLRGVSSTRRDQPPALQLVERLAALESYVGEPDPTVTVVSDALAPKNHAWPRTLPVLGAAAAAWLLGALGWLLALWLAARGRRGEFVVAPAPEPDVPGDHRIARRETQLEERVRAVARREREVVRRAGELAARERALREREELAAAEPPPPSEPEPEPEPQPEVEVAGPVATLAVASDSDALNLGTLERLVDEHGAAFPDRLDEWQAYLFYFRGHATNEGFLPPSFDPLVDEVFGDLLDR